MIRRPPRSTQSRSSAASDVYKRQLQDTLKTVTTKLDDQSAAMRKAMADQTLAVNNIGDNVRVLREKTDETNVRISTMSQGLEAVRQTIAPQPTPQPGAP